jgi:lipopolysaccharide/colanic/teichoic acid biosynthesis glycosyltransferase
MVGAGAPVLPSKSRCGLLQERFEISRFRTAATDREESILKVEVHRVESSQASRTRRRNLSEDVGKSW